MGLTHTAGPQVPNFGRGVNHGAGITVRAGGPMANTRALPNTSALPALCPPNSWASSILPTNTTLLMLVGRVLDGRLKERELKDAGTQRVTADNADADRRTRRLCLPLVLALRSRSGES
jgi:hypothetical protein